MPRLIDADALLVEVEKYCDGCNSNEGSMCKSCEYDNWLYSIEIATTIEAAPVVHGYWIDMGDFESCSVCKSTRLKKFESMYSTAERVWTKTSYCPDCGAKMDLKSEEAN